MSTPNTGPQAQGSRQSGAGKDRTEGNADSLASIKGPLIFSFVLALIGGAVATLAASGGTDNPIRVDIGLLAFGVFFIVSLVVVAMLQLAAKDNPDHLSQGSGVYRSSEELHQQAVDRRRTEAQRKREQAARDQWSGAAANGHSEGASGSDPAAAPRDGTALNGEEDGPVGSDPRGAEDTPGRSTR